VGGGKIQTCIFRISKFFYFFQILMAGWVAGTEVEEQLVSRYCHHLRNTNADLWNQLSKISECAENIVINSNSVSILT